MTVNIKTIIDAFLTRTNFSDMNLAEDINALQEALKRLSYITLNQASFANIETISATKTLTDDSPTLQILTPSTADRDVMLPAVAATNPPFIITNPSGGSYNLIVKNAGGVVLRVIYPSDTYIIFSDGVTWRIFGSGGRETDYKIVPTVASNNLTLALKHLDGTDPSASRPLWFKIADSWRAVTAALSVTVNAGANTFNAGSAELATKEIDYFAYLSWRAASSAVVIGYSRIPYANLYSDFSGTATDEKYGAFSTAPAAGDDVVVIGRFAATLSAGAGYTWTVPTYTTINLIHTPITNTRWMNWSPVSSCSGSLTYTSITNTIVDYIIENDKLNFLIRQTGTLGGTASNIIYNTLPFNALRASVANLPAYGRTAGVAADVAVSNGTPNILSTNKYDLSNYATSGSCINALSGSYRI